jgi:mono/diheme cytochrome c family protein
MHRAKTLVPLALALALGMVVFAGCNFSSNGDKTRGRMLFIQKCGTCHTLAQAGTAATVGPNLDDAFAQARAQGMDADTIKGVVKIQVEHPRPAPKVPTTPSTAMPPGLVEGQDLEDVASYVGSVAGIPGIKPPAQSPPQFFASTCGSCHTLKAAGSTGTVGPDLDKVLPGMAAAQIMESIVNPGAKITPGYPPNVMPTTFGTLPKAQLAALVDFLVKNAGK